MRRVGSFLPLLLAVGSFGLAAQAATPALTPAQDLVRSAQAQTQAAPASSEAQPEKGGQDELVNAILGHVENADELEFTSPAGGTAHIPLPTLRIPLKANACPASVEQPASLSNGCLDISLTKHAVMMWFAGFWLLLFALLGFRKRKKNLVPRGLKANVLEMGVLFIRNDVVIPTIGKEQANKYTPYICSIFFFILFMNLLGIFPWMSTPTGNLSVTGGLALCTFVLTEIAGLRSAGVKGYFAHLSGGAPKYLIWMMVPIEIMGKFTKPFALTVRLFANMIAGHIVIFSLLGLIMIFQTWLLSFFSVPFSVFMFLLEIFIALIQAYIFAILSAVFISLGLSMGHHEAHAEPAHEAAEAAH